ncbi:MAG: sulfite exporter TauE/SafE family protein [Chloroflexi bacterium]|nr:sulfite exporter TauE/SafE family protein [Chloroflexota bacterium]
MDPRLVVVGLVVGLLVGLTGVGGSSVLTPLLILTLGVQPLVAVGTDLAYSVPTKLLGALIHRRQGTVEWRVVGLLCVGGLPASLAGLGLLALLRVRLGLDTINVALKHGVGALLLIVAVVIVLSPWLRCRQAGRPLGVTELPAPLWTRGTRGGVIALGALVGVLVSLTSIGAGSVTVPVLYLLLPRLGLRRVVGSDVSFAALLIPTVALGHLGMGDVNLGLSLNLLAGSLPGVFIGSKLCARLPDTWLRPAMAGALLFAGTRLV